MIWSTAALNSGDRASALCVTDGGISASITAVATEGAHRTVPMDEEGGRWWLVAIVLDDRRS